MARWLDRLMFWRDTQDRYTMNDWLEWMSFNGITYQVPHGSYTPQQTLTGDTIEPADGTFEGHARSSFTSNPVVFACEALRTHVFSGTRFQWQLMVGGRQDHLFGNEQLEILERPWLGGTTQDLLNRMLTDADIAGTSYLTTGFDLNMRREIVRLRPDWVDVFMEPLMIRGAQAGWRKLGALYYEGGRHSGNEPVVFGPDEFTTFTPMIDPLAQWRGMSWLTPVIREIQADALMTGHRRKFFERGATPNMIITFPVGVKEEQIRAFKKINEANMAGVDNAYKRLYIGGGADATVVGVDLQKSTFKEVQGGGETRIAAAAGTPVVLVGLSEGLQGSSLNSGNYQQARRRMADITAHPLWMNACGSLAQLVGPPPSPRVSGYDLGPKDTAAVRLWYDARDMPFLREDEEAQAKIMQARASTLRVLLDAGFEADSAKAAVMADDLGLLKHTGLFSVQLQPPMTAEDAQQQQQAITTGNGSSKQPAITSGSDQKKARHNRPGDHPMGFMGTISDAQIGKLADGVYAKASSNEPAITGDMKTNLAEGAELAGLPYRLKTRESLEVKIRADSVNKRISPETAASEIFDSVRYTQASSPDRMATDANHMLNGLRSGGYEVVQVKNTWQNTSGNPYQGVNVKLLHPSGLQVELQFHTPESLATKEKIHGLYNQQKLAKPGSPEWTTLNDQMNALSGQLTVPKDVHTIG